MAHRFDQVRSTEGAEVRQGLVSGEVVRREPRIRPVSIGLEQDPLRQK
ncbi:hypothetical protein [Actinocorallia aurantiaca]